MARLFGASASDRIDAGSDPEVDSIKNGTAILWEYPTTLTTLRSLIAKFRGGTAEGWDLRNGASGQLEFEVATSGGFEDYITSGISRVVNTWYCTAATWSESLSYPRAHIYFGNLAADLSDTGATGSSAPGTFNSDADRQLFIGNRDIPTINQAYEGRIAVVALFDRVLTLAEMISWQRRPRPMDGCVRFYHLGWSTSGVEIDQSPYGRDGTIVGTTVADGPNIAIGPIDDFLKVELRAA